MKCYCGSDSLEVPTAFNHSLQQLFDCSEQSEDSCVWTVCEDVDKCWLISPFSSVNAVWTEVFGPQGKFT